MAHSINFFVKRVKCKLKANKKDKIARFYLLKMKQHEKKDCIRVGFIVQATEIWDKQVDVYNEMLLRENMEVVMLVVPSHTFLEEKNVDRYKDNYFLKYYPEAVKAISEDGKVINIEELKLDYVFYQRPYDHYLPFELQSDQLVRITRCCYIPYGFVGSDVFNGGNTSREFFRNMYFSFFDSEYMRKLVSKKFKKNDEKGYQHFEYLGYPSLVPYLQKTEIKGMESVLWTPRWSYDEKIGGSHFLEYKDFMVSFKNSNPDINMIFRPHPLMFDELERTNRMTREEKHDFIESLDEKGIYFDHGTPIYEAIMKADVMVTDFSTILIMFFLTGKPIIYCESNIQFNEIYQQMKECIYVANNQEELENYLKMLREGNDYMRPKRLELINDKFKYHQDAEKRIVDRIIKDYWGK